MELTRIFSGTPQGYRTRYGVDQTRGNNDDQSRRQVPIVDIAETGENQQDNDDKGIVDELAYDMCYVGDQLYVYPVGWVVILACG